MTIDNEVVRTTVPSISIAHYLYESSTFIEPLLSFLLWDASQKVGKEYVCACRGASAGL